MRRVSIVARSVLRLACPRRPGVVLRAGSSAMSKTGQERGSLKRTKAVYASAIAGAGQLVHQMSCGPVATLAPPWRRRLDTHDPRFEFESLARHQFEAASVLVLIQHVLQIWACPMWGGKGGPAADAAARDGRAAARRWPRRQLWPPRPHTRISCTASVHVHRGVWLLFASGDTTWQHHRALAAIN